METNRQRDPYIIRGGQEGLNRLAVLHRALAPTTWEFFIRSGLAPGDQGLDLGCGGGGVSLDIARIVGPAGSITGIDMDAEKIAYARQEAERLGLHQAHFQQADIEDLEDLAGQQDFAYARFLLTHLPDPAAAISRIHRVLKTGGRILLEDIDFAGHFCYPACQAFDAYVDLYTHAVRLGGADPHIGPRLPLLVQEAGFRDVQIKVIQPVFRTEEGKQMASLTLENIADTLILRQLASPETIEEHLVELRSFEQDEHTLLSLPRIFQVWALK